MLFYVIEKDKFMSDKVILFFSNIKGKIELIFFQQQKISSG